MNSAGRPLEQGCATVEGLLAIGTCHRRVNTKLVAMPGLHAIFANRRAPGAGVSSTLRIFASRHPAALFRPELPFAPADPKVSLKVACFAQALTKQGGPCHHAITRK